MGQSKESDSSETTAVPELNKVQGQVEQDAVPGGPQGASIWSIMGSPIETVKAKYTEYTAIATSAAERCTDLIVIFLLETVVYHYCFCTLERSASIRS